MSNQPPGKSRPATSKTKRASKSSKKSATKTSKKGAGKTSASGKDAKAFFDLMHSDKTLQGKLRKGWLDVLRSAKQRGYNFDPRELQKHFVEKYGIRKPAPNDDPDTCICMVCL